MATHHDIMIIAGEASGDALGKKLVIALGATDQSLTFYGVAGPLMREAGVEAILPAESLAVMGFWEVLCHWRPIWRAWQLVTRCLRSRRPDLLVLIDYPGFNIRVARYAKRLGIKVVYYVSPKVWVWKPGRLDVLAQCIDKMLVLHAFEKPLYVNKGIPVAYVGHALMDDLRPYVQLHPQQPLSSCQVALLPGSRLQEIKQIMPVMMAVVESLTKRLPGVRFVLLRAPFLSDELWQPYLQSVSASVEVIEKDDRRLSQCDLALAASGTVTLELGVLGIPTVVLYKLSTFSYALLRCLTRIRRASLVNIIAQQDIFTECLQGDMVADKVIEVVLRYLLQPGYYQQKIDALLSFNQMMGAGREDLAQSVLDVTGIPQRH